MTVRARLKPFRLAAQHSEAPLLPSNRVVHVEATEHCDLTSVEYGTCFVEAIRWYDKRRILTFGCSECTVLSLQR